MWRSFIGIALYLSCTWVTAQGAKPALADVSFGAELRLVPEVHDADRESDFFLPTDFSVFPEWSSRHELELQLRWRGFNAITTLHNRLTAERKSDYDANFNELYWDGEVLDQDLTIGKKIRSFGVGFGFRPLDVLQRENRRRLYPDTLSGATALTWNYFGERDAWTVTYANPLQGKDRDTERKDESFVVTYYRLQGDTDLHALVRFGERHHLEGGAGFATLPSDVWAAHASLLYQRRGERLVNSLRGTSQLLAADDPMVDERLDHPIKAVAGGSWTDASGWSGLGEIWYDGEAYDPEEWRDLTALTQSQRTLLGAPGVPHSAVFANIAASSQAFASTNLQRWNTLVRLGYDGDRLDPNLEVLYTPEDGGYVVTLNTDYALEQHRLRLSVRTFGGPSDSAYRLLPEEWVALVAWEWTLF